MPKKPDNFLSAMFETRHIQAEKGRKLVKEIKTFQEITRLREEIITNVKHIVDSNFPPITARLDQIVQLLVAIGQKVDMSDLEKEVLGLLKAQVQEKNELG